MLEGETGAISGFKTRVTGHVIVDCSELKVYDLFERVIVDTILEY